MPTVPPLVGRAVELARIGVLLDLLQEGRAGGLIVFGEPGVGKTRLLCEAANDPSRRGVRVAHSGCLPLTTPLPFDPVLQLLRSLGEPLAAVATESPRELFGIVVDRLERATIDGPLVLCLDDLQWSDAGTLDLVHHGLARLADLPIAWLLAARPAKAVVLLAHRLVRAGVLEQLELEALSFADMRRLAEAVNEHATVDLRRGLNRPRRSPRPAATVQQHDAHSAGSYRDRERRASEADIEIERSPDAPCRQRRW